MSRNNSERYLIEEQIGSGGMATVYRGTDTVLQRPVALKTLNERVDTALKDRFQQEARAVAQLNHPNVVSVYDVGESEGTPYIVMEYVQGSSLKKLIQERGAMPPEMALSVVSQVGRALSYAHESGLVHCDVKPHNILVTPDGTAKLLDFGIAQAQVDRRRKRKEQVFGSPLYIAPEQAQGKAVSPRTDVYGLGLVLWEALTGSPPERDGADEPARLDFARARLPAGLARVIERATAHDPAARYASVDGMLQDLQAWNRGSGPVGQDTVAYAPIGAGRANGAAAQEQTRPARAAAAPPPVRGSRRRRLLGLPLATLALLLCALVATGASTGLFDGLGGGAGSPLDDLGLTEGTPSARVKVPDFKDMTFAQAQGEAADAGLKVSADGARPGAKVISQTPKAGRMVPRNGNVRLTMSGAQVARRSSSPTAASLLEETPTESTDVPTSAPSQPTTVPTQAPESQPTPVLKDTAGVWEAQLSALEEPVSVTLNEDGRVRTLTLDPGEYVLAGGRQYLQIRGNPARQLAITVDGARRGTLLDEANCYSPVPVTSSNAIVTYTGSPRALGSCNASGASVAPAADDREPDEGDEKDDKGRNGRGSGKDEKDD